MEKNSWQRDLIWLFPAILLFFCIGLGERPYITPSEARYIEIPRQILTTGDWLTPHINGVQYFEKPPLFYWLQAIALNFGYSEFWGRIATAIITALTCIVTYATGRLLYGRSAGLLAAITLATSILGYGLSRIAMLDAPVSLFISCTLAAFIFAYKTGNKKFYYLMYAAAALAVMTKGLIGIAVPGMVIGCWIAVTNNWKILKEVRLFSGIMLFLAITMPWHVLMAMKHPEFFNFYFIHEHFTRFLSDAHRRTAPWWFFITVMLAGAMPYIWLLGGRIPAKQIQDRESRIFLLLWIILPLIFFSTSHSKLVPYIFPVFPALFILIGRRLAEWWPLAVSPRLLKWNNIILSSAAMIAIIVFIFLAPHFEVSNKFVIYPLALVTSFMFVASISREPAKTLIISIIAFAATLSISANYVAGDFDKRTIKPLAEILKPILKPEDIVVSYDSYWQDIPVYLERDVAIVNWSGELTLGLQTTPNVKDWMWADASTFWQECAKATSGFYVFVNTKDFAAMKPEGNCQLQEIGRYGKTILLEKIKSLSAG